jgi:hypothetical protein
LQHGDKTVAKIATAHLEDVQAAKVLGLWDPFATLLHDLEYDAKHCDGYRFSRLGLDLTNSTDLATHHHVLEFIRKYLDRQRALELFGALRPKIQTFIENSESGKKLLGSCLDTTFTWDEVRTLATEFETREKTRDADVARQLKKLGIDVPKQGKARVDAMLRLEGLAARASMARARVAKVKTDAPGAKAASATTATLLQASMASSLRTCSATAVRSLATSRRRTAKSTALGGSSRLTAPSTTTPTTRLPTVRPLPLLPVR